MAVGAEARHEKYSIGAGDEASYTGGGSQGFAGFRPANAGSHSRHNESIYVNLEAEATKNLSGGVALRHERYSDFGSTTSAKGSARYAFSDALSLRGTVSSGFRAPSLAQQYYTITTTNFQVINGVNTAIETGTFAVNTPQARALGAQDLKPEKARNYSLGLQFQPSRNFTTTVDAYRIDIDNRILFSANLALSDTLEKQSWRRKARRWARHATSPTPSIRARKAWTSSAPTASTCRTRTAWTSPWRTTITRAR